MGLFIEPAVSSNNIFWGKSHCLFFINSKDCLSSPFFTSPATFLGDFIPSFFYTCSYDKAKRRYARSREEKLSPGLHLASAAEAGALVSIQKYNIMNGQPHL
jgi:solute carrier family 25 folate transporter 32